MSMIDTPNSMHTRPYVTDWEVEYVPDEDSSPSDYDCYDDEQVEAFRSGEWSFIGIQAWATVVLPRGGAGILQRVTSPGLWSVESNSSEDYLASIAADELSSMLDELNVEHDTLRA